MTAYLPADTTLARKIRISTKSRQSEVSLAEAYLPLKQIIIRANEWEKTSLIEDKQLRKHHRSLENNCLQIGVIIIS